MSPFAFPQRGVSKALAVVLVLSSRPRPAIYNVSFYVLLLLTRCISNLCALYHYQVT